MKSSTVFQNFSIRSQLGDLTFSVLYHLGYFIFCLVYLPHFVVRARRAERPWRVIRERFGFYPVHGRAKAEGREVIWIHAVSVGEVMAVKEFIRRLAERVPSIHVVLTTVTPTGQKIAQELASERICVCYVPFEFTFAIQSFLKCFDPQALLLMETEVWPNLIRQAEKRGLTVGILNARLSERSTRRYATCRFLFGPIFQAMDFVLVQTLEDGERFIRLGIPSSRIQVMGSMKFDNVSLLPVPEASVAAFRKQWGFVPEDKVWIAGSTHAGEEEMFLRAFKRLKQKFSDLKAIVAPRHINRAAEVLALVEGLGLRGKLASDWDTSKPFDVLVLNQLGILKQVYALADFVYVGGSLIRHGGQNPIEPASQKKPILHGPYVFNFEAIYSIFLQKQGAVLVRQEEALYEKALWLLEHPEERKSLGENAFEVVRALQGATDRQLNWVMNGLSLLKSERNHHAESSEKLFSPFGGRL